jgi:hypothetical protein
VKIQMVDFLVNIGTNAFCWLLESISRFPHVQNMWGILDISNHDWATLGGMGVSSD